MIPKILSENELDKEALLLLMNAIYFKATWTDKFDANDSKDEAFTTEDGVQKTLPMMHRKARAICGENDIYTCFQRRARPSMMSSTVSTRNHGRSLVICTHGNRPQLISRSHVSLLLSKPISRNRCQPLAHPRCLILKKPSSPTSAVILMISMSI